MSFGRGDREDQSISCPAPRPEPITVSPLDEYRNWTARGGKHLENLRKYRESVVKRRDAAQAELDEIDAAIAKGPL